MKSRKHSRQKKPRQRISISRWVKNNKQWLQDIEFGGAEAGGGWRSTKKYKRWRQAVLERDDYRCVRCGTKRFIEIHHIIPASVSEDLRYDVRNGETLCRKHHETTPHQHDITFWKKMID